MKNLASNFKPLPGLNLIGVNKLYQNIVFWFHKQYLVSCITCYKRDISLSSPRTGETSSFRSFKKRELNMQEVKFNFWKGVV